MTEQRAETQDPREKADLFEQRIRQLAEQFRVNKIEAELPLEKDESFDDQLPITATTSYGAGGLTQARQELKVTHQAASNEAHLLILVETNFLTNMNRFSEAMAAEAKALGAEFEEYRGEVQGIVPVVERSFRVVFR